jgi:hypothetical protein
MVAFFPIYKFFGSKEKREDPISRLFLPKMAAPGLVTLIILDQNARFTRLVQSAFTGGQTFQNLADSLQRQNFVDRDWVLHSVIRLVNGNEGAVLRLNDVPEHLHAYTMRFLFERQLSLASPYGIPDTRICSLHR